MNALTPLSDVTAVPHAGLCFALPEHSLFSNLSLAEQALVSARLSYFHFDGDAPILVDGAPLVGLLRSGAVARTTRLGSHVSTVGLLLAGDMLILEGPRTANVRSEAVGKTEIFGCSAQSFQDLLRQIPQLQLNYLALVTAELQATRDWYTLLGRKTATERVATLILKLSRHAEEGATVIDLLLTRDRIGNLLGIKMETVSRQIRAFAKAGVIALFSPTKIQVLDKAALLEATGDIWREKSAL